MRYTNSTLEEETGYKSKVAELWQSLEALVSSSDSQDEYRQSPLYCKDQGFFFASKAVYESSFKSCMHSITICHTPMNKTLWGIQTFIRYDFYFSKLERVFTKCLSIPE